jgi:hypothetical protein
LIFGKPIKTAILTVWLQPMALRRFPLRARFA